MPSNHKHILGELHVFLSALTEWPEETLADPESLKRHRVALLRILQEDLKTSSLHAAQGYQLPAQDSPAGTEDSVQALIVTLCQLLMSQRNSAASRVNTIETALVELKKILTREEFFHLESTLEAELSRLRASQYNHSAELLDCPFCGARPKGSLGPMFGVNVSAICCSNDDCLASARQVSKEQWNTRVTPSITTTDT